MPKLRHPGRSRTPGAIQSAALPALISASARSIDTDESGKEAARRWLRGSKNAGTSLRNSWQRSIPCAKSRGQ